MIITFSTEVMKCIACLLMCLKKKSFCLKSIELYTDPTFEHWLIVYFFYVCWTWEEYLWCLNKIHKYLEYITAFLLGGWVFIFNPRKETREFEDSIYKHCFNQNMDKNKYRKAVQLEAQHPTLRHKAHTPTWNLLYFTHNLFQNLKGGGSERWS